MPSQPKPIPQVVAELWELVVAYFKQETTEPLKNLGRVLGLGIAGSLLLATGVLFVAVGLLRLLQEEVSAFDGNWSWVPYAIVTVVVLAAAGITWKVGTRKREGAAP